MIFLTAGTDWHFGFDRVVRKVDEIAKKLDEPAVMQIGPTQYTPVHARAFDFISYKKMLDYFKQASLVIGHASVGPILHAQMWDIPVILVPRQARYKEEIIDHQVSFARSLETSEMLHVVYEMDEMELVVRWCLENRKRLKGQRHERREMLIRNIRAFVGKLV